MRFTKIISVALVAFSVAFLMTACSDKERDRSFTLAVIPDTQNYLDYLHQTKEGFPFDAVDQFYEQLRYIAAHAVSNGGTIAFATSVGDVWQHATQGIDEAHMELGLSERDPNLVPSYYRPDERTRSVEMPAADKGYRLLKGVVPFSVAPGNHDYDGAWLSAGHLPTPPHNPIGQIHYNGLNNFNQIFSKNAHFFKDADYYVDSYNGGANSATRFNAGGYQFLHIALEMQPANDVLVWAQKVLDAHRGMPTIFAMHEYLNTKGKRESAVYLDLSGAHEGHNTPEDLWQKIIRPNDQVFLVLSGHFHGQSRRVDKNAAGHEVHQILADYQDRNKTYLDAGGKADAVHTWVGDGWMRLMAFDFGAAVPSIGVRTYSTHYKQFSSEFANYAAHYRDHEQPGMSDAAFLAEEEFTLALPDFVARFGKPN